jgi:hypothetical protein
MKNLNEELERMNMISNYKVGVVLSEQIVSTGDTSNVKVGNISCCKAYGSKDIQKQYNLSTNGDNFCKMPNPTDLVSLVSSNGSNETNIPCLSIDPGIRVGFKSLDNKPYSFEIKNIMILPNKSFVDFDYSVMSDKILRVLKGPNQDSQSAKCQIPADILKYYSKQQKLGNIIKYNVTLPENVVGSVIKSDPTHIPKDFIVLNTIAVSEVVGGYESWTPVFSEDGTNYNPEFKEIFLNRLFLPPNYGTWDSPTKKKWMVNNL